MIDHVYLDLYNQGSTVKNISISYEESPDVIKYITNDDIVINTFSLNESAFSGNELKFGSLVSSKMSFKIFNKKVSDALINKELNVKEFINYDTNNPFVLGKYRVKTEKSTADKLYRQIEAYDCLYDIVNKDVSAWYESLKFPLSQKEFRDSFFSYIGIEQVQTTLVNDNMMVTKTISATELPGKIVLSAICEINGAIGRINRDGKFAYVVLETNPSERITLNKIVSGSGSYEDNDTTAISKVQIRNNENDIGAIVGEDGNTYVVQDNFLVYGKSSTDLTNIANNLLSVISGISYRTFNAKFIYGNPCYEIGDAITVVSRNATFNSYIFNRTLNGINAITDTINAKGTQIYSNNINSKNNQILQLENRTNELVRTVDGIEVRVTETDKALSKAIAEIGVNATNIELKVSKGGSIADINASVASGQSEVKISADAISLEGTVTANETFKINTDGSMEATGGKIGGLDIKDNGFRGSGFELEQAEILFGDDDTLPIIKKQACLRLEGVTEQYGWNTTSKVEYSGNGVKSNYVDTTINKSAFDLEILPIRKVGRNSVDAKIKFHTLYYQGIEDATETISLDGSIGEVKGRQIKTYGGADLDTVKAKAYGSLKSTYVGHATGTSSAFPSVDISSIPNNTMMRIEVGIPIDNASSQSIAWFSTTVKKSSSTADYLYNCGGYYYSANYNASVFISVSNSRVTINNAWTKVIGGSNAAAVNNLKSKSSIYVYTENL